MTASIDSFTGSMSKRTAVEIAAIALRDGADISDLQTLYNADGERVGWKEALNEYKYDIAANE